MEPAAPATAGNLMGCPVDVSCWQFVTMVCAVLDSGLSDEGVESGEEASVPFGFAGAPIRPVDIDPDSLKDRP